MVSTAKPDSQASADGSSLKRAGLMARELLIVVVGALVVSTLLRAFVGQMFIIPSQSMESTLLVQDRVVVQKLSGIHRGDVVVFADPGGWLADGGLDPPTALDKLLEFVGIPTANAAGHLIKRVIGMPGDVVKCCGPRGRMLVNGYALDERSYLYTDPNGVQVEPSTVKFEVVVPRDRIFVMGDHRDLSADSRCHLADLSNAGEGQVAFVPLNMVVGSMVAIAWPPGRASLLHRPATFAEVPAPTAPAPELGVIKPEGVSC